MPGKNNKKDAIPREKPKPPLVVVMGVSGSGKTTIGLLLAAHWGVDFYDGDDFHPKANVAKMEKGDPLNDEDRQPWLQTLNQQLHNWSERGAVLGCSALKTSYRIVLQEGIPQLRYVHLTGTRDLILARMKARKGHFMPPSLLDSQIATLEIPEDAVAVDIDQTPEEIKSEILSKW
ncbi:MAG: gluconokinase [Bacteroidota bacterium]